MARPSRADIGAVIRALGIVLLVLSLFLALAGWGTKDMVGDEATWFASRPVMTATGLEDADEGDRVVVEGRAQAPDKPLVSPVSGKPAAWYRVTGRHRWQTHNHCEIGQRYSCTPWSPHSKDLPTESQDTMFLRIDDSKRVMTLPMSGDKYLVAKLFKTDSDRTTRPRTEKIKNDYEVRNEYLIEPGARLTVAGEVRGTGDDRTLARVKDYSLIHQGSRDSVARSFRGDQTTGTVVIGIGVLLGLAAVALLVRDHRRRRARSSA
jgi:hypothetical protein